MVLIGEILLAAILAYMIVCIVQMMVTKRWIAFLIVMLCLVIYAGVIVLFTQPEADFVVGSSHDHYKCE